MVDFNLDNGTIYYLPKNLSNEDYHDSIGSTSLLYSALQLCECKGDRFKCVELHQSKSTTADKNTSNNSSSHRRRKTPQLSYLGGKAAGNNIGNTCKSQGKEAVAALDLAFSQRKIQKCQTMNKEVADSEKDNSVPVKGRPWYLPSSRSPVHSESDTVYSEDYIQMTDEGSDSGAMSQTSQLSDCSSLETLEGELEKMGLKESDLQNQNNIGDKYGKQLHILKESEVPNLRLILGQKPEELDLAENEPASPKSPEEETPVPVSTFFGQDEFDYLKTEKRRRSSSLKSYKTPPGTPSRKKAVRFADALGLDLEDVRHFLNNEDPPTIPPSAMKDLQLGLEEEHKGEGTRYLRACFAQPGANLDFVTRVLNSKVALENCLVNDSEMTITGIVRVANISFHKRVIVRFTTNHWTTFTDINASYVQNSNDGPTDRFSFTISVPSYFEEGHKLEFAMKYSISGQEFWDSNYGANYIVECYAKNIPVGNNDKSWVHFL